MTDITGLIAFVIGWLSAGIIGWPYIKAGFDTGEPASGVLRFIIVVFGVSIASGLVGMLLGAIGGNVWEAFHRRRRARAQQMRNAAVQATAALRQHASNGATPTHAESDSAARPAIHARPTLPALRYDSDVPDTDAYVSLAGRAGIGIAATDHTRVGTALGRTINVAAWDGEQLVGIARVLTDGLSFAALVEVLVDPALQRRGVGRELINRVFERTPRGVLLIGSPLANTSFFDHLGCDRGPTGFTMRRAAVAARSPARASG